MWRIKTITGTSTETDCLMQAVTWLQGILRLVIILSVNP